MDRPRENYSIGCGSGPFPDITLNVQTTTGGNFSITVNSKHTVENLKKIVSKKLKVSKDRICLLHREQQLRNGTMEENGLIDGSRVILLPSVETGLLTQRPENSVMQALESLNDTQVNDFLSGKSPLNLTMRLGDHMMLIQLQLSTLNAVANCANGQAKSASLIPPGPAAPNPALRRAFRIPDRSSNQSDKLMKKTIQMLQIDEAKSSVSENASSEAKESCAMQTEVKETKKQKSEEHLKSFLNKQDIETLQNAFEIFKSLAEMQDDPESGSEQGSFSNQTDESLPGSSTSGSSEEQTPIKSLSNFVSSPMKSTVYSTIASEESAQVKTVPLPKFAPLQRNEFCAGEPTTSKAAVCLCSTINPNFMCDCHSQGGHAITKIENFDSFSSASTSSYSSSKLNPFRLAESTSYTEVDSDKAINLSSGRSSETVETFTSGIQEPIKNRKLHYLLQQPSTFYTSEPISTASTKQKMTVRMVNGLKRPAEEEMGSELKSKSPKNNVDDQSVLDLSSNDQAIPLIHTPMDTNPISDTKALIEASKNLTQTLKKLSKEVLTSKVNLTHEDSTKSKIGQGAVIESMKHHGKGIYSGTFSGTLNPALQDRYGRPKRDISTIIHILNDLLCAAPAKIGEQQSDKQSSEAIMPDRIGKAITEHRIHGAGECGTCASSSRSHDRRDAPESSAHSDTHRCRCVEASGRRVARAVDRAEGSGRCRCRRSEEGAADCAECHTAAALALDNSKTKCKLERLRLVMQQEKRRREARKKAPFAVSALPLPLPPLPAAASPRASQDKPPLLAEEIDTVA